MIRQLLRKSRHCNEQCNGHCSKQCRKGRNGGKGRHLEDAMLLEGCRQIRSWLYSGFSNVFWEPPADDSAVFAEGIRLQVPRTCLFIKTPAAARKCCRRHLGDPTTAEKEQTLQQTLHIIFHKALCKRGVKKGRIERDVSHAMRFKVVLGLMPTIMDGLFLKTCFLTLWHQLTIGSLGTEAQSYRFA